MLYRWRCQILLNALPHRAMDGLNQRQRSHEKVNVRGGNHFHMFWWGKKYDKYKNRKEIKNPKNRDFITWI